MNHYHFADESGDAGIVGGGSSRFYILALVEFSENDPINELVSFRIRRSLPPNYEFKFHRTRSRLREQFFDLLGHIPISIRAIAVNKESLQPQSQFWNKTGDAFILECFSSICLDQSFAGITGDHLIVDAAKSAFLRSLRRMLSLSTQALNKAMPFKKVNGMDSYRSDGLQAADMVVGALRRLVQHNESSLIRRFETNVKLLIRS